VASTDVALRGNEIKVDGSTQWRSRKSELRAFCRQSLQSVTNLTYLRSRVAPRSLLQALAVALIQRGGTGSAGGARFPSVCALRLPSEFADHPLSQGLSIG